MEGNMDVYSSEDGLHARGTNNTPPNSRALTKALEKLDRYGDGIIRGEYAREVVTEYMRKVYEKQNK